MQKKPLTLKQPTVKELVCPLNSGLNKTTQGPAKFNYVSSKLGAHRTNALIPQSTEAKQVWVKDNNRQWPKDILQH